MWPWAAKTMQGWPDEERIIITSNMIIGSIITISIIAITVICFGVMCKMCRGAVVLWTVMSEDYTFQGTCRAQRRRLRLLSEERRRRS